MRTCWIVLVFVLGNMASSAPARPFLFDLGTEDSALRQGFTRITPKSVYSKAAGFGWRRGEGLKAHHQHYGTEWQRNESRGVDQPPPIYTNEITCDCIFSERPNAFLVDVTPGEYTVYVLCGRSAGSPREYHDFDVVAGQSRMNVKIPGPAIFEKRVLRVRVVEGPLAIEFVPTTDWLAACLIVYPASEDPSVRSAILDSLEKEVYFLPAAVAEKWKETKHVDDRPMPPLSSTDRQRGYAIFARHYSEVVYPNTVPRPEELNPRLKTFASLGEYEPVTFTVLPLADLPGATVTASDLRCGEAVLPAANIDIRAVRYMRVRPNYSSMYSWHIAPDVLERFHRVDLRKGCNQTFWITVKTPEDARPGVYEGKLTFAPATGPSADVPLALRVLPIRLKKNPEHIYGMYYYDPLRMLDAKNTPAANAYFQRKAELERRDMIEHGMNTHTSNVSGLKRDEQGRWTIDGEETDRRIALDRKYGLADKPLVASFGVEHWYAQLVDRRGLGSHLRLVRPDVPPSFFDEVTKMVETIEGERKRRGWPELLYYPIDEPSTEEKSVRFMVGVLEAIKRVPGVRTYVTADPSHEQFEPLWPYVDVWCCQPFVFGYEKIQRLSREKRIEFWCYPNHISGENDHTPVRGARMTWGFGFWKSGFKALIPWIYQSSTGDPWNYLDGPYMDFFNRSTPEGEPIPVALWEAYREGIDDGRYLYTLEQLVAEAKSKGGKAAAAAAAAEKELRFVWDSIQVQEKYKYDGLWSGADFDAYRWLLAAQILKLQEAVR
jgi:hypothetical protein